MRRAAKPFGAFTIALAPMLGGCGTYVPSIQEIGDDPNGLLLVQAIIESVHCELRNAATQIYWDDQKVKQRRGSRVTEYFDKWGAQVQLQLTVEETTRLNPSASWMPNMLFSLGSTATLSAEALYRCFR